MTFRQFAFNNVFRNKRLYVAYFLSSLFTVMVFFTFANFAYHTAFSDDGMKEAVMTGMKVSGGIIYVFSFFFILYSMSAFLQSRKKEFGVLMIQGMSSRQIRWMVFLENMIIGILSIVVGIGLGILFSKGILLVAENLLVLDDNLQFYFPIKAILITFASFLVLFLFISFFVTFILRTNKLIKLIKDDQSGKGEPKASIILTVLGVLLLGSGYAIALIVKGAFVAVALLPVVILVTIGTYFLFSQISVFVIGRLKRNKRLFWKKTNMLLFSDLSYRMKDNARAFFIVAIISTVAFSAIGSLVGFKSMLTKGMEQASPVSYVYYPSEELEQSEMNEHVAFTEGTLKEHNLTTKKLEFTASYFEQGDKEQAILIVTAEDYNAYANLIGKSEIQLEKDAIMKVVPKDVNLFVSTAGNSSGYSKEELSDIDKITLADESVVPVTEMIDNDDVLPEIDYYYIVNAEVYEGLAEPVRTNHSINWQVTAGKEQDIIDAGIEISEKYPMYFQSIDAILYGIEMVYGPIMFVGLFIGIIFFVSAGSFLYFRLYADLDDDKAKFKAISKIGLTTKELKKVISRQTALLFFAPIIVALMHGAVALTALSHMFEYDLKQESALVLGAFLGIQVIYYLVVRHFYTKQIMKAVK